MHRPCIPSEGASRGQAAGTRWWGTEPFPGGRPPLAPTLPWTVPRARTQTWGGSQPFVLSRLFDRMPRETLLQGIKGEGDGLQANVHSVSLSQILTQLCGKEVLFRIFFFFFSE